MNCLQNREIKVQLRIKYLIAMAKYDITSNSNSTDTYYSFLFRHWVWLPPQPRGPYQEPQAAVTPRQNEGVLRKILVRPRMVRTRSFQNIGLNLIPMFQNKAANMKPQRHRRRCPIWPWDLGMGLGPSMTRFLIRC